MAAPGYAGHPVKTATEAAKSRQGLSHGDTKLWLETPQEEQKGDAAWLFPASGPPVSTKLIQDLKGKGADRGHLM